MKHLNTLFIAFLGLLFTAQNSFAQEEASTEEQPEYRYVSIAGQIKDSETGDILSGVKITNETRNNANLSKGNGFYTIVAVTGDIIRFSHIGYAPIYMKVNQDAGSKETVMVEMDPTDIEIEAVDVRLPSLDELNEVFMAMEVDDDKSRELAERNPETFRILEEIEEPAPGGPVSFLKKHVFDKIKQKSKKKGRAKNLPKYKE